MIVSVILLSSNNDPLFYGRGNRKELIQLLA